MNVVTMNALSALMDRHDEPCVSLFIPTLRADGGDQNLIRFKNARNRAEKELEAYGFKTAEVNQFLERLDPYLKQNDFWDYVPDGVAFYLSHDFFEIYQLPFSPEEIVLVNQHFYVKPIFHLLADDGRFFLLLLNQRNVRLFEGSRYAMRELAPASLPPAIEEALSYVDRERQLQLHTKTSTPMGQERSAMYHGHGAEKDSEKIDIEQYFRMIDKALHPFLRDQRAPLVVAGIEYQIPIYESVNTYPSLVRGMTGGHLENRKVDELHNEAWEFVGPRFAERRRQAAERYQQLKNARKSSTDLREVLQAANDGRVGRLFLNRTRHAWGLYEPKTQELLLHETREPGDEDLLNTAGVDTLLKGGEVFLVDEPEMPEPADLAANFRY